MILNVVLLFVFLGVFGSTMREGLWNNTVRLLNLIFAATIATSLGEPVAKLLTTLYEPCYFFYNFLGTWLVFGIVFLLLRELTTRLSTVQVKFHSMANLYGSYGVSFLLSLVFVSFLLFTMHQAPLSEHFMRGDFQQDQRMFFGLAPDRQWHDYFSMVSAGAYAGAEGTAFDPNNDYGKRYARYRAALEKQATEKETSTIGAGQFKR